MTDVVRRSVAYSDLASEYYDAVRHPTCANFREASKLLLLEWLNGSPLGRGWTCEVGAGRSLIAEAVEPNAANLENLILLDESVDMLSHSQPFAHRGACLVLGDVRRLPVATERVDAVVSILGDAYNDYEFWSECARVLRPGGQGFFTAPAFEWANRYRSGANFGVAEFIVRGDKPVVVPSIILDVPAQAALIQAAGLFVRQVLTSRVCDLAGPISPKLLSDDEPLAAVVTGFVVGKHQGRPAEGSPTSRSWFHGGG